MFKPEIKQRAIELRKKGNSAGLVLKQLRKDFSDEELPTEKTIRTWQKKAVILEKQIVESGKNANEYRGTHPIPKWAKNVYLVKIENGEIKPL